MRVVLKFLKSRYAQLTSTAESKRQSSSREQTVTLHSRRLYGVNTKTVLLPSNVQDSDKTDASPQPKPTIEPKENRKLEAPENLRK